MVFRPGCVTPDNQQGSLTCQSHKQLATACVLWLPMPAVQGRLDPKVYVALDAGFRPALIWDFLSGVSLWLLLEM